VRRNSGVKNHETKKTKGTNKKKQSSSIRGNQSGQNTPGWLKGENLSSHSNAPGLRDKLNKQRNFRTRPTTRKGRRVGGGKNKKRGKNVQDFRRSKKRGEAIDSNLCKNCSMRAPVWKDTIALKQLWGKVTGRGLELGGKKEKPLNGLPAYMGQPLAKLFQCQK